MFVVTATYFQKRLFVDLFELATQYCFELFPARVPVVEENYARALLWMSVNRRTLLLVSPIF